MTAVTRRALLIWWSTNTRAASVLLAAARASGLPCGLIIDPAVAPPPPAPAGTRECALERVRSPVSVNDLDKCADWVQETLQVDEVVLAPTSEYLMHVALGSVRGGRVKRLIVPWSSSEPYSVVTSKACLPGLLEGIAGLRAPHRIDRLCEDGPFPSVAKPVVNIQGHEPLKPFVLRSPADVRKLRSLKPLFFVEEWVSPPSYYWCAYRSRSGRVADYFQLNILQEPGGGSIALAVAERPPWASTTHPALIELLERLDFVGPAMVELRGSPPVVTEINPRFWGPLLLDLMIDGGITQAFLLDQFGVNFSPLGIVPSGRLYAVPRLLGSSERVDVVERRDWSEETWVSAHEHLVAEGSAGFSPTALGGDW